MKSLMSDRISPLKVYLYSFRFVIQVSHHLIYCVKNRLWEPPGDTESLSVISQQQQQLGVWLRLWELMALITYKTNGRHVVSHSCQSARRDSFRWILRLFVCPWLRLYLCCVVTETEKNNQHETSTVLLLLSGLNFFTWCFVLFKKQEKKSVSPLCFSLFVFDHQTSSEVNHSRFVLMLSASGGKGLWSELILETFKIICNLKHRSVL